MRKISKGFPKGSHVPKRFKGFPKSFKAFWKGFKRVSKRFKRVSKRFKRVSKGFQKCFQRVSEVFPKGFKPSETRFQKGFRVTSNPLKNAFVDKTCFRMEGHTYTSTNLSPANYMWVMTITVTEQQPAGHWIPNWQQQTQPKSWGTNKLQLASATYRCSTVYLLMYLRSWYVPPVQSDT